MISVSSSPREDIDIGVDFRHRLRSWVGEGAHKCALAEGANLYGRKWLVHIVMLGNHHMEVENVMLSRNKKTSSCAER